MMTVLSTSAMETVTCRPWWALPELFPDKDTVLTEVQVVLMEFFITKSWSITGW